MRASCNGCRVLRKGCTDNCNIRTCLQWIKSPESQANATVFLAKFYGRAGLMNLINAGPEHLRSEIFKSLLYEACGRIVDPMYGSVGLLWSRNWHHCQAAVDAVLRGSPIMQLPSDAAATPHPIPPLNAYDIRHVSKDSNSAASHDLHKVKTRTRYKRSAAKPKPQVDSATELAQYGNPGWGPFYSDEFNRAPSHDDESMFSVETVEGSLVNRANPDRVLKSENQTDDSEVGLELTLGFPHLCAGEGRSAIDGTGGEKCKMELGFSYTHAP